MGGATCDTAGIIQPAVQNGCCSPSYRGDENIGG